MDNERTDASEEMLKDLGLSLEEFQVIKDKLKDGVSELLKTDTINGKLVPKPIDIINWIDSLETNSKVKLWCVWKMLTFSPIIQHLMIKDLMKIRDTY